MADKKVGVPENLTGTTLKMGVKDRLLVGQLLPQKGSLLEQRLIRDIMSKSELTQEEMRKVKMISAPGVGGVIGVTWSAEAEKRMGNHSIRFSEAEIGFIKDQIKKLDEKGDITRDTFEFCERINSLGKTEKE